MERRFYPCKRSEEPVGISEILEKVANKFDFKCEIEPYTERVIKYMKRIENTGFPNDNLSKSFKSNRLAYAVKMLSWRDSLICGECDSTCPYDVGIIGCLLEIENGFNAPGIADYIRKYECAVRKYGCAAEDYKDKTPLEIKLNCNQNVLNPIYRLLLDRFKKSEKVKITFGNAPSDENEGIGDSKKIIDLLRFGLLLQDEPRNLNHIINYLSFPIHPLDLEVRCDIVTSLIEMEEEEEEEEELKSLEKNDNIFYRIFTCHKKDKIIETFKEYCIALRNWAEETEYENDDLIFLSECCDDVGFLIEKSKHISLPELYFWLNHIDDVPILCADKFRSPREISIINGYQILPGKSNHIWEQKEIYDISKQKIDIDKQISYTRLNKLIQYPFEFVLTYICKLKEYYIRSNTLTSTKVGRDAHRTISKMFTEFKVSNGKIADAENIKQEFRNCIEGKYNTDNIENKIVVNKLCTSFDGFVDFIIEEKYTIEEVEKTRTFPVANGGFEFEITFIPDLVLKASDGKLFIIDFKWSALENFGRIIRYSRDLQLALYRKWYQLTRPNEIISGYGYFQLNTGKLYIPEEFSTNTKYNNSTIKIIKCKRRKTGIDSDKIYESAQNSYFFRINQLLTKGKMEQAENMDATGLEYYQEQEKRKLYPLNLVNLERKVIKKYAIHEPNKILKDDLK